MKQAILKTLIYADLFEYPLTKEELWRRLIWQDKSFPLKQKFRTALSELVKTGKVKKTGGLWFLPEKKKIVGLRLSRDKFSKAKLRKAEKISRLLRVIPLVKLVAVTGSTASKNARKSDDVDFLVVAKSGWLWTTRFLTIVLLSLLKLRRRPNDKKFVDKICLNMFLDEDHLGDFSNKDLFVAYEILQLKLLWQRGNIYQKFLSVNSWVKNFLPNFRGCQPARRQSLCESCINSTRRRVIRQGGSDPIVDLLQAVEELFYRFQIWWMRKRRTKEVVTPYYIAFHKKDIRKKVLRLFSKKSKRL